MLIELNKKIATQSSDWNELQPRKAFGILKWFAQIRFLKSKSDFISVLVTKSRICDLQSCFSIKHGKIKISGWEWDY